jgi:hypothetical protein
MRLLPLDLITAEMIVTTLRHFDYCDLIIPPFDPINLSNIEVIQEKEYVHLFPIPSTLTTCYGRVKIQRPMRIQCSGNRSIVHNPKPCGACGTLNTGVLMMSELKNTHGPCRLELYRHLSSACPFTSLYPANTARKLLKRFNRNMNACNQYVKENGIIEKLRKDFHFITFPDTFIECLFYQDGTRYNLQ